MSDVVIFAKEKIKACSEEIAQLRARLEILEKTLADWKIVLKRIPEVSGAESNEGDQEQKTPKVQNQSVAHKIALLLKKTPRRTMAVKDIRAILLAENPEFRKVKNLRSLTFSAIRRQPFLFKKIAGKCKLLTEDFIVESTGQQTEEEIERML